MRTSGNKPRIHAGALFACAAFLAAAGAQAQALPPLAIDKVYERPSGWVVGQNDAGGCLAAASYKDGTSVWIGFDRAGRSVLAFTNEAWSGVRIGESYTLQMRARGQGNWRGSFVGFERRGERGFIATGLKSEFLRDFANAGGIWVYLGEREMARLSLSGSRAALNSTIDCQKIDAVARAPAAPQAPAPGAQASAAPPAREPLKPQREERSSSGTGFFVSQNGHVLTNDHVVKECRVYEVGLAGGPRTSATLVARDTTNDLALLRTNLKPEAVPAFSLRPRIGESVYAYGFPLVGVLSTSGNFTIGNVTATAGLGDDTRHLQISTPVQVGNSGGPLLDQFGNVAGVVVSKLNVLAAAKVTGDIVQNVNFAIKSAIATNFLDANGVSPNENRRAQPLDPATIAEGARAFTVLVTCK
ncbi:MAG: S1C family serine protease [Beijerinckiaceae bacterium]